MTLFVTVDDPTSSQIIRREHYAHAIPFEHSDLEVAHLFRLHMPGFLNRSPASRDNCGRAAPRVTTPSISIPSSFAIQASPRGGVRRSAGLVGVESCRAGAGSNRGGRSGLSIASTRRSRPAESLRGDPPCPMPQPPGFSRGSGTAAPAGRGRDRPGRREHSCAGRGRAAAIATRRVAHGAARCAPHQLHEIADEPHVES